MGHMILWCVQCPPEYYQKDLLFPQTDADPEVCKRMCKANHCENVMSLVTYYQMVRQYILRN